MKTNKVLGFLGLVVTAFAAMMPLSVNAEGHIRSIDVYTDNTMVERIYPNNYDPATYGETVKFKVRLANGSWKETAADVDKTPHPWVIGHIGAGDAYYDSQFPLQLGLWVSGKLRYATIESYTLVDTFYTDVVFSYKVQAGDFALPIKLANASGTGEALVNASSYHFKNADKWWFTNDKGDSCEFYFGPEVLNTTDFPGWTGANETRDKDLSKAGIYVRAIDFDSNYQDKANDVWRTIEAGMTSARPAMPALAVPNAADDTNVVNAAETIDLFVWTEDETIADVALGGQVLEIKQYNTLVENELGALVSKTRNVAKVRVKAGSPTAQFPIQGKLGAEGKSTSVYLSAFPTNRYDASNTLIVDFTERTISVIEPPDPFITLKIDGGSEALAYADDDYKTPKVVVTAEISQPFTKDVTITVNPKMLVANPTRNCSYYFSSFKGAFDPTKADDASQQEWTLTIPKGVTESLDSLNIYVLGADADTVGVGKGIAFEPSVTDADAIAFLTGTPVNARLEIQSIKPIVTMPDADYVDVPGGVAQDYTIHIVDSYRGLAGEYKVYWCNSGVKYDLVDGVFVPVDGNISVPHRYSSEGSFTSGVYVVNENGIASDKVPFEVSILAPKKISGVFVDEDGNELTGRRFNEGETVYVKVKLNQKFEQATSAYVFLKPSDTNIADYVYCPVYEDGDGGMLILEGDDESATFMELTLLDGCAATKPLQFDFEIRTEDSLTEGEVVSGYTSSPLLLIVENVKPLVEDVTVGGVSEDVTVGGVSVAYTPTASKGVAKQFKVVVNEPSDKDIEAVDPNEFETEWIFIDGANATQSIMKGDPSVGSVTHAFFNAGTNAVRVRVKDKDMTKWENNYFEFKIVTKDTPAVSLSAYNGTTEFLETDVGSIKGRINVSLTEAASVPLEVEVTIARNYADDGNYPIPELNNETSNTGTERTGTVKFAAGQTDGYFYFTEMDGTPRSGSRGFKLSAKVTTTDTNPDGVAYSDLYLPVEAFDITVVNEAPLFSGIANTNVVEVGMNVPIQIDWSVIDIDPDLTNGLVVTLSAEGKTTRFETGVPAGKTWFEGSTNVMFTSSGDKTVTLTVKDKDGDIDTRNFYYHVAASKELTVIPVRPANAQTEYTKAYSLAAGVGVGRVWADGAFTKVDAFWQLWNYEPAKKTARVYAQAYKAGDIANGSLGKGDIALTPAGDLAADASQGYFTDTKNPNLDNFFYKWVIGEAGENSKAIVGTGLGLDPADYSQSDVILPEADTGSGEGEVSYSPSYMEAIFSREFYEADNAGDINADRIPDVFIAHKWQGGYLYNTGSNTSGGDQSADGEGSAQTADTTSDLNEMTVYNGDADFLPGKSLNSSVLIPGQIDTWALVGQPFNAVTEIRGYGEGLNLRESHSAKSLYTLGKWTSVPDYTPAEMAAFEAYKAASGYAGDIGDDDNPWSPENRTDPTVADTDGDGYPDGYEYYFWYNAHVGRLEGTKLVQMTGEKFNLKNIAKGDLITSEEIAEKFNPTVARAADVYLGDDTDNDGLTDLEELAIGTNPVHWDSDGDGISDLWEVMNNLDPLNPKDASSNDDGDFMASCFVTADTVEGGDAYYTWAVITVPDDGMYAIPNNGTNIETGVEFTVTDGVPSADTFAGIKVFYYGNDNSDLVPVNRGSIEDGSKPLDLVEVTLDASATNLTIQLGKRLRLVHDQVYNQFGFDPRTAWYSTKEGFVSNRWNPALNDAAENEGESGVATNTVRYSALDEYLVLKYRYNVQPQTQFNVEKDLGDIESGEKSLGQVLASGTTVPSMPYADKVYGTNTLAFTSSVYGADTDGDGVPDGWELYVGYNPNNSLEAVEDYDDDDLKLAQEFAGTDSCNAYKVSSGTTENGGEALDDACSSIYANHPGNLTGWFNKFFPTDPNNADTDGDHVSDGDEGSSWEGTARYDMVSATDGELPYVFSFIYGTPTDDGALCCIRGGGMNPCSVDTDMDMLPDAWEKQFAGVLFNPQGQPVNLSLSEAAIEVIRRNDGLFQGDAAVDYYITAGMDATYGPSPVDTSNRGDAYTSGKTDPRTGTKRNFDFDHDGLENYQEYLVQTLRHLRYDDSETPLMGSYIKDGAPKYVGNFLRMQTWDGESFIKTAIAAKYTGIAGEDFKFRELGYFARPPRAWDRVSLNKKGLDNCTTYPDAGYRILLPPQGLSENVSADNEERLTTEGLYVSTDPRLPDTDGDGMDDFYELFHGLNPLLGTANPLMIDNDIIGKAYNGDCTAFKNAWGGWASAAAVFDPIKAPWFMGVPDCDADGDGLRNMDEMIQVNSQDPQPSHTDPTPLWMTDSTSPNNVSYTSQYYFFNPYEDSDIAAYDMWLGSKVLPKNMFAFEENEGYDTDGDNQPDNVELTRTINASSDPLNFMDPIRRQALWFPGTNSAAISHSWQMLRTGEYAFLRQFTVEAWIRPDTVARKQVILERAAVYGASTLSNNTEKVKANFRIGITEDGKLYGCYDSNNAVDTETEGSSAKVIGPELEAGKWAHVALSYDGTKLRLYHDGILIRDVDSSIIPANGITVISQSVLPDTSDGNEVEGPEVSATYVASSSAILLGARGIDGAALQLGDTSDWASYGDFYAGALDEVRIWDGARKTEDITADYMKRYTFEEISQNRLAIFEEWRNGATRNDNDGKATLSSELVFHYNFQTLPSAVEAANVAQEPVGFTKNVLHNIARPDALSMNLSCGWWQKCPIASTVYLNRAWVPWIQNTIAHLPSLDGRGVDSIYWSTYLAGFTFAGETGLNAFLFPNTANPYSYVNSLFELDNYGYRLDNISKAIGDDISITGLEYLNEIKSRYSFTSRSEYGGGKSTGLLPLGGAFAKRMTEMWDGNGPSTAWINTSMDSDGNGFPDWWEAYARATYGVTGEISPETLVNRNGALMTAREAYLRDLSAGVIPNADGTGGILDANYADNADADYDGLPDWWENLYDVTGVASQADSDNDQLSNWAEYLIGEGFVNYGFPFVSPSSMRTGVDNGQKIPDYFLVPEDAMLYLGEMFADHDFMEDSWEDKYEVSYISRGLYDSLADRDDDGWSNYAECRANTDPTVQSRPSIIAGYTMKEHPIPEVNLTVSYNGNGALVAPLYIKAYSDVSKIADAVWVVSGNTEQEKYIGVNPNKTYTMKLGPGAYQQGSLEVAQKPTYWRAVNTNGAVDVSYEAQWAPILAEKTMSGSLDKGEVYDKISGTTIGEIDYKNGIVTVDFTKLQGEIVELAEGVKVYHDLSTAHIKFTWTSIVPSDSTTFSLNLADPKSAELEKESDSGSSGGASGDEESTSRQLSMGRLREGNNTFIAWLDKDNNGEYSVGEPYGVVTDVDVGWNSAKAKIELTEVTPQLARMDLQALITAGNFEAANDATDRGATGLGTPNVAPATIGTNMPVVTKNAHIRIKRDKVNIGQMTSPEVLSAVLYDKVLDLNVHPYLTEADILAGGGYDLDWGVGDLWKQYNSGVPFADFSEVTYRIVVGDSDAASEYFDNNLPLKFVNKFEMRNTPTPITAVSPVGGMELSGSPTFTWTHENTIGKVYPAFQIRIWKADREGNPADVANPIYDSGVVRAPTRNKLGQYVWTAPIYEGMVTPEGHVFSTTETYVWSITMLDAKFTSFPTDATKETFRLNATSNKYDGNGYGAISVAVKYFGALAADVSATVSEEGLKNMIHVQAFENPDFTGKPVSEGYVTDVASIRSAASIEANATIRGLPVGKKYYIRAYLDTNASNTKDQWESWGYSNYIGSDDVSKVFKYDINLLGALGSSPNTTIGADKVYTPKAVELTANGVIVDTPVVFMEDADVDNDGLPDSWEMHNEGTLGSRDAVTGSTFFAKVNPELSQSLPQYNLGLTEAGQGSGSGYMPLLAALLSGDDSSSYQAAILLGQEAAVTEASARIVDFSPESGTVIEADTETTIVGSSKTGNLMFSTEPPEVVVVKWELLYSDTLDGEFTVVEEGSITVVGSTAESAKVDAIAAAKQSPKYNEKQGFFKVNVK